MPVNMEKYIGVILEMIYINRNQIITQRKVKVLSVQDNLVNAYCFLNHAPRTFRRENILAITYLKGKWSA